MEIWGLQTVVADEFTSPYPHVLSPYPLFLTQSSFGGAVAVVDAEVETFMGGTLWKIAIDRMATIANGDHWKDSIKNQINQCADEQTNELCKWRQNCANNCDSDTDFPVEILLRVKVAASANHTIKQAGFDIPESRIIVFFATVRTKKRFSKIFGFYVLNGVAGATILNFHRFTV